MSKLIALVATAVMVGGVRTVIQPGQELPELPEHDERELLHSGMAQNPIHAAATKKASAHAEAEATVAFQTARKAVQQAKASTTAPADASATAAKPAAGIAETEADQPAAKAAARK